MPFEDDLKRLIAAHERRLNMLELRKAESGSNTPGHILHEIEEIRATIAHLQTEIEELQSGQGRELPGDTAWAYHEARKKLSDFQQKLETLPDELGDMTESAKVEAAVLLEFANQQRPSIENDWESLNARAEITKNELESFIQKVTRAESVFSVLVIRRIHRQNLQRSKDQLESQQLDLLPDQLQKILQPKIRQEEEAIQALENQSQLSRRQRTLLESHRQNLQLYEEMLAGARPYAPVELPNQIIHTEQAIKEIDTELAAGKYRKEMEKLQKSPSSKTRTQADNEPIPQQEATPPEKEPPEIVNKKPWWQFW